jgi:ribosomal protein L40E
MAQKTVGYVELEWTCKRCGTKNPGTVRTCTNCGAPMADKDAFEAPAEGKLITEPEKLAAAQAGPDVHCPYCGARNPAGTTECAQCGGDLKEAAARQSGQVVGAFQTGPAAQVVCPACGTANPANAPRCGNCGAGLVKEPAAAPAPPRSGGKAAGWIGIGVVALIGLVCLVLAAVVFLARRTTGVPAVVQGVRWERSIPVLELLPAEREGWEEALPQEAEVEACELRYRETRSEPAPNATEVCGTPYTIDEGSGLGKVVQDCEYEVYDSWCTYQVDEWQVVDTFSVQGSDLNPRWPGVSLASTQREGAREENYSITFAAESDGRLYTYETDSLQDYLQFTPGSEWELLVNTFGSVTEIESR